MATVVPEAPSPPSARWASYDGWNYNGMKERLERFMSVINKSSLVEHTELIIAQPVSMSEAFSAGQFWCCFELRASDGRIVIARVRLPRHPDSTDGVDEHSELYSIRCEVETMKFLHECVTGVPFPRLLAYEGLGSQMAANVGAAYMLIEGFYGNTLQDVQFNICELPIPTQEHIITQWTSVQAELATFIFPQIGSISNFSKDAGATIGKLSTAVAEGLSNEGPFTEAWDYFATIADARFRDACKDDAVDSNIFTRLGPFVFKDIVQNTDIFKTGGRPFHFNHMDMGTQNILVDQDFNFLAIIDWEFAQTAPLEINHYPMPFPLISADAETDYILQNPDHIAHRNVSRQVTAQKMYRQKFRDAEQAR
ncbi:hypothetical protein OCU04_005886 [Sclerotinia nivalis]|uniref:Aminoglycoside phosphotransferase domain-containing protein n=1 Tax=Sclerotinia nivalis TaxID=352851 RepID=A0A9X0ALU9_9HELO|nr:hypothetical protein OCU04_005886 [Sclerotinia nivalis]